MQASSRGTISSARSRILAVAAALSLGSCAEVAVDSADEPQVAQTRAALHIDPPIYIPTVLGGFLPVVLPSDGLIVEGTALTGQGAPVRSPVIGSACPSCTGIPISTAANGTFAFDPRDGIAELKPVGEETVQILVWPSSASGLQPLLVYHQPKPVYFWAGNQRHRKTTVVNPIILGTSDSDGDLLANEAEAFFGTDANDEDTDGDGLSDAAELYGADWVDYPALGADPLHKDVFIEVDYEGAYTHTDGVTYPPVRLSDAAQAWLVDLYGGLAVTNPDGEAGVSLHLIHDTELPGGVTCWGNYYVTTNNFNPRHRDGFRYAALCYSKPCPNPANCPDGNRTWGTFAYQSQSVAGSFGRIIVRGAPTNQDPSDDLNEGRQYNWVSGFAHEIGHTLSLQHGGGDGINCKPNYPSLMNYAYDYEFNPAPVYTLAGSQIQFSPGTFVNSWVIDERTVDEDTVLGAWSAGLGFLRAYGTTPYAVRFNGAGRVSGIDWNRDGDFNDNATAAAPFDLRNQGAAECTTGGPAAGQVLRDFSDAALLDSGMANNIPGVFNAGMQPSDGSSVGASPSAMVDRAAGMLDDLRRRREDVRALRRVAIERRLRAQGRPLLVTCERSHGH